MRRRCPAWTRAGAGLAGLLLVAGLGGAAPTRAASGPLDATSDSGDGASALVLLGQKLGHRTEVLADSFDLGKPEGVLFELNPFIALTHGELDSLDAWIKGGGVLVYGSGEGVREAGGTDGLDDHLQLHPAQNRVADEVTPAGPVLGSVRRVQGIDFNPLNPLEPDQVPLLRTTGGAVMGVEKFVGKGRVVALRDPYVFTNALLARADNGHLAAALLDLDGAGATIRFDEYHRDVTRTDAGSAPAWWTTPWGAAVLWAIAVLFIGFFIRGRAFGVRVPRNPRADRSSAEYATAVGSLLRRAGARELTLRVLTAAAQRAVAARVGLRRDVPPEDLQAVLEQRAPALAAELREAATEAGDPRTIAEGNLLRVARRLHALAHPPASKEDLS